MSDTPTLSHGGTCQRTLTRCCPNASTTGERPGRPADVDAARTVGSENVSDFVVPSIADANFLTAKAEAKAGGADIHDVAMWCNIYRFACRYLNDPSRSEKHEWCRHLVLKYDPRIRAFILGRSIRQIEEGMGKI